MKTYCYGCGRRLKIVPGTPYCGECYDDWIEAYRERTKDQVQLP